MQCRRISFVLLLVLVVGCTRSAARKQGPRRPPPPYSPVVPGQVAPAPAATAVPGDDPRLMPPKPPDMPPGQVVPIPQTPRPPAVPPPSGVIPAGGFVPPPTITPPTPDTPPQPRPRTISGAQVQNVERLKAVHALAAERWAAVDTFEAKLTRRESMTGKDAPTEEVLFQFRKEPFSVYMRNVGGAGLGREVLFVKGKYDNKMKILTGKGDGFSGLTVTKSPDDPFVKARSRNDIRDAGFGTRIGNFKAALDKIESGKAAPDSVKALGSVKRPEYAYNLEGMVFAQPDGGWREVYFDPKPDSPSYGLPVVSVLLDSTGRELEYNCFTSFRLPANLTDADFTPDRFGKKR